MPACDLELGTPFGWRMQCPSGMNPRTIRNFPMQSTGSEILHVLACWPSAAGSRWWPRFTTRSWRRARPIRRRSGGRARSGDGRRLGRRAARLPAADRRQIIRPGERYFDDRGEAMWDTVTGLLAKLDERETA